MHRHSLGSRYGTSELSSVACDDGVYWDGSVWRVCLHGLVPTREDGTRPLEQIEMELHGGAEGCRVARDRWLSERARSQPAEG